MHIIGSLTQLKKGMVFMLLAQDIMLTIKDTISTSIRRNTVRGFIGCNGCDNICLEMYKCLDICRDLFDREADLTVLEAVLYILLSQVKLASNADSSSGMLTDVIDESYKLIEKCTEKISKQDKQMRDKALGMIIKQAKKKAYDGWSDMRYDLLKYGICLCDDKNGVKLEKAFDNVLENDDGDFSREYTQRLCLAAKYLLHRHLRGKEAVKAELYEHIDVNELRIIAVKDAVDEKDFKEAERLCLDKIDSSSYYNRSNPNDWNNILFDVYVKADDTDKQINHAKKLLLLGTEKFWDVLKQLYERENIWEEKRTELLDEVKNSGRFICYRSILVAENEMERLFNDVMENPSGLFHYGGFLVNDYPEQIYELCAEEITNDCVYAKGRKEYKKACKKILQLIDWKGNIKARELIEQLRKTYPRRTALLDELERVERKL